MTPDPPWPENGRGTRFELTTPHRCGCLQPVLRDALHRIARFKQLTCPQESVFSPLGRSLRGVHLPSSPGTPARHSGDLVLSWILGIGRRGTDGRIKPLRLELTRPVRSRALLESTSAAACVSKPAATPWSFATVTWICPRHPQRGTAHGDWAHLESELQERNAGADVGDQVSVPSSGPWPASARPFSNRPGNGYQRAHAPAPADRCGFTFHQVLEIPPRTGTSLPQAQRR